MKGPRIRKYLGFLVMALALILVAGQAKAGYIDDRNVLDALLGPSAPGENFESFSVPDLSGTNNDFLALGSSYSSASGAQFLVGSPIGIDPANLQVNGQGYRGQPSQDLVSRYSKTIIIDFTGVSNGETEQGVCAFGLDLLVFHNVPYYDYDDQATVTVFGNDDSVLYTSDTIYLWDPGLSEFFGFFDDSGMGIKSVAITGSNVHDWSPIIDDLTFGTQVVPIPSAVWLLGTGLLGLVGLRKKFK